MYGYLHPGYAESLSEFGAPRSLPRSGGWILERPIPGFPYRDAMGCYPLFCCRDWSQLGADLEEIGTELVSLSLVTDPFGNYDYDFLTRCFDFAKPFKEHFVIDCSQPMKTFVSKNHQYQARKALKKVSVELYQDNSKIINQWMDLYNNLILKYNIRGIRAFSRQAFSKQLDIPGMIVFCAYYKSDVIGAALWFLQGDIGYAHLVALNDAGYETGASYALYWRSIEYLLDKVRWLTIGASSGISSDNNDGLSFFKRGWSTGVRPVYFCGKIFDSETYSEIVSLKGLEDASYFPAYRAGEFS